MALWKPATPGFLVTLIATVLLLIVTFSVPQFKSVYFLKVSLAVEGIQGTATFGTLGYCLETSNETSCSKPSIGYEFDINKLVGNKTPVNIPSVAVKWITYALFLHAVALIFAAISAVFGLLAHVREMSMTCCSSLFSGIAASLALLAFVFDLAFFYLARSRLNSVQAGSAQMGNAIWLTLVAWILLFFSGCFYTLGRSCIKSRPKRDDYERQKPVPEPAPRPNDQLRLDAVKAEADRKARAKQGEVGLPAFAENTPLRARIDGDNVYLEDEHDDVPYRDHPGGGNVHAGYAQAPLGTRTVDEYYAPSNQPASTYPPQPARPTRQGSDHTTNYAPSSYESTNYNAAASVPSPPMPNAGNQYLAANFGQNRYANTSPGAQYGHTAGGSSYHSATSHYQQPSTQRQNDGYTTVTPPQHGNIYSDPYVSSSQPSPFNAPQAQNSYDQHQNYYGSDGYGANHLPPLSNNSYNAGYTVQGANSHALTNSPPPINTTVAASPNAVKGPRSPRSGGGFQQFDDHPPTYDSGNSGTQGNWSKR